MDDKKKALYDALSGDYDLGTYEEFSEKLNDEGKRKALYDAAGQEYNLGTYEEYSSKLGFEPSVEQSNVRDFPVFDDEPNGTPQKARGFKAGARESWKGLKAGFQNLWGEAANMVTGSSQDAADAVYELDNMLAEGRDVVEETADAWSDAGREIRTGALEFLPGWMIKGWKERVLDKAEKQKVLSDIRDVLGEAGGDVDKARELLVQRAQDQTYGDKQIASARDKFAGIQETEGLGAWIGSNAVQMIPSASALIVGALTKSPGAAKAIGMIGMGGMTAATAGSSMYEARQAGADDLKTWKTGVVDGMIEYITEKLPFDRYTSRILGKVKGEVAEDLFSSLRNNNATRNELERLLKNANERLGGKLFSKKNLAEYVGDMLAEGASEFSAEALQTMTAMMYEEPENYPTLSEILKNGWEGAKAGFFMGAVLGGASKTMEHNQHRKRRMEKGSVDIAQVDFGNGEKDVVEVVDYDDKTNTATVLHDGSFERVSGDAISDGYRFSYDEFENARLRELEDEAIVNGNVSEGQVQGMEETLARDTEEIMKLDPSITEEALRSGEVTAEEGSPLAEAIRKYNEDTARLNELAEARKQEVEARKAATRQQLEQSVGQPFWMQEDAGDGRYTETVEEIVYSDGRTGYVVGYDDAGNLTLVFSDGTKGFSSREDITNKLNSGEIVSDTPMGLDAYIESKVAQEDAIAEQARMSEEHALSIEDMIATHPQGTVINLGTEEEKIEVTIIAPPTADGAIVQMPDGTTPLMRWEDIAHAERTEITPKTDAQINQSVVDQYKVAYKPAVEVQPEPDATVREQAVERETPAKPLPLKADGTVDQTALWNEDPARWAKWNDEQRNDGGANSLNYISGAVAKEQAAIAEMMNAYNAESDFDARDLMEAEIQKRQARLNELMSLQAGYMQAAQQTVQQTAAVAEEKPAPVPQTPQEVRDAENKRREPLRRRAQDLSKKLGVKVNIAESLADVKEQAAREQILMTEMTSDKKVPGWFNPATGEVTIYLPHAKDTKDLEATIIHEVVAHKGIRGLLGEEGFNVLCDSVWEMMTEEERQEYLAYPGVNGNKRAAADEYIAHYAETLDLESSKPVWDRIINLITRILNTMGINLEMTKDQLSDIIVASYQKLAQDALADSVEELAESVESTQPSISEEQLNAPNSGEASQITATDGEVIADTNGKGGVRFSIRTWLEGGRDYLVAWLAKDITLAEDEKADILARMDEFYKNALLYSDSYAPFGTWSEAGVRYDNNGNPLMSVIKANGDYAMNLDFSLVCKKRRPLNRLLRTLVNRNAFSTYTLRERELAEINWILQEHGFEVACALCFVDSKRYRVTGVADVFASLYNRLVKSIAPKGVAIAHFNYSNNPNVEKVEDGLDTLPDEQLNWAGLDKALKGKKEGSVEYKVAQYLREHPEARRLVDATDFIEAEGFESVKENNPDLLKFYNMKKGTGGPKASFGDVQYLNDILKNERTFSPEKAYAVGGVRLQSFSDFVPHMYFDYMQLFAELAAKKLPVHAYTKEVLFAKIFGLTGAKINLSLVPAVVEGGVAPGLDTEGNYAWADPVRDAEGSVIQQGQTFPFDEAMAIQNAEGYSKNCGAIAVGISDAHIEKMLDDPNIQFIIPYHKSSLNAIVARMTNIDQYKDYTNVQNTRKSTGSKLDKGTKDFNFNEYLHNLGESGSPQQAAQAYLDWCRENGFVPKFSQFAYHPNYYKLLVDFNTIDTTTGEYAPQGSVSMIFPTEQSAFGNVETLIQQGLQEDAELEEKLETEINSIADQVLARLAEISKEPKLSEKQQAKKMAELADERMAKIQAKAEGPIDILEEARKAQAKHDAIKFRFIGKKGARNLDKAEEATIRLDNLAIAKKMEKAGKNARDIKLATGWERGADKLWRYEEPDFWIDRKGEDYLDQPTERKSLSEYVDNYDWEYFIKAYPELSDLQIEISEFDGYGGGYYIPAEHLIVLRPSNGYEFNKSAIMHEVQHAIQDEEGFASGAEPEQFTDEWLYGLNQDTLLHALRIREQAEAYVATGRYKRMGNAINHAAKINDNLADKSVDKEESIEVAKYRDSSELSRFIVSGKKDAERKYLRVAGEVEARNVKERYNRGWGNGEYRYHLASETEDVARKDQIFLEDAFKTKKSDVSFRITAEQDKAYMDAVEAGDMETAQRMVEEAAAAAGYTIRGDHGRVSKFTIFDRDKANPEGNWGQGFYFTNNEEDVENNYASVEGPDLEAKIEREVERRVNLAEMNEEFNEDGEVDEFAIREAVESEFITSEPNIVHAAINMNNPFVVGHGMVEIGEDGLGHYDMQETYLTAEYETDEDGEADYSIDPTGTLVDLVEALNDELSEYEGVNINAYDILSYNIDGMTASQFEKEARELLRNSYDYLQNDDLAIMTSEIIRAAIERAGFDGIVDNTVNQKFGTARRFGRAMEGVDENTRHYIAFQSSQIKETDPVTYDDNGNVIPLSERFNPENEDIRFRVRGENESAMEFHQSVVDEHLRKYNDIAAMEVFPVDEATAKRFGYTLDQLKKLSGLYDSSEDLIAIFAKEEETDSIEVEDTIFHESVHKLVNFFDYLKEVGEWMWSVADKYKVFADIKKRIEQEYSEDEYAEEMMCFMLGGVMPRGLADGLLYGMPEHIRKQCEQIFNEIGYDSTRESIARLLGQNGESAVVSGMASEENRTDEGRRRSEKEQEGSVRFRATEITPEVRDEMDTIAAIAIVNGNYLKAPNGADTNLTAEQWAMVRTKNFKAWFGDWENDPENASKVVDENGEPKVVFHGGAWRPLLEEKGNAVFKMRGGLMGKGAYFTDTLSTAIDYAREKYGWEHDEEVSDEFLDDNGYVTEVFLNIRNEDNIREYYGETFYLATNFGQIKSAVANTGEFSQNFDIRFRVADSESKRKIINNTKPVDVIKGAIVATDGESVSKAALRWFEENVGKELTYNTEVGTVTINRRSVKNSLAHGYSQTKLDAITSLPEGFGRAVYLASEDDFDGKPEVNHYFVYPINYDGSIHYVLCRVKSDVNKSSLYIHEVFPIDAIKGHTLQTAADQSQPHRGISLYLDLLKEVLYGKDTDNLETANDSEENVSLRVNGTPTDEVVASGLSLSPAQTADLAGNIFAALPEESRKKITDGLNGNILGLQDAIMQIPARLAMKENWDDEDKAVAEVIAEQMTKAVGMEMTRPFSASEALWTLYNATHKDNDIISEASRALVRSNLGFDSQTLGIIDEAKDGVRFRTVGDASANAEASLYNRGAANVWTRLKESYVDMNASVEKLMKSIEKASGKVAQGFENILMALNQQSSKGLAAMESYTEKFLNPMFDEIVKIMKKAGKSYQDVVRYVILKHGLERNVKLAQRDAKAHYQEIYDDIISKITGMNDAQKRTYLTNAQLKEADAKAELARLQAIDQSTLTDDQLRELKRDLAKARKAVKEAEENLKRAEKIRNMSEQEAQDELGKIFEQIESGKDSVYKDLRNNDYSGISSMFYDQLGVDRRKYSTEEEYQAALMLAKEDRFSTLADVEAEAKREVAAFEKAAETKTLWKRINAATKETLRQQYEANMISKEQYLNLRDMFEYYVPLRGFKDNTAEDMYTYYRKPNSTGYTKPILGAEGRKTEAESPFGWIASMAGSAIASNVKNEAKLALYYFVSNRPDNGIATVSKTWFVHTPGDVDANGKRIFKPAYPAFNEDLSTDAAKQAYEIWQANMKELQKQGLAYESGQRLNLGNAVVNIDSKNQPEHIVTVKVGGKDYTIVINGNPRAAQAINGDLNIESTASDYSAVFGPVLRWMSSVNTSYNPEFWITNTMRDMLFTMMSVNIKEDPAYRRAFRKNYWKAWQVVSLTAKNEKGTIGDSYMEKMYKDFVKYGGVTGYTQIKDSETWEKEIDRYLKSNNAEDVKTGVAMKRMKDGFHAMHRFGESLEQVSRFAAFVTAREQGKSMAEAVNDAKEITVNFNRKGSGKMISLEEAKTLTNDKGQPLKPWQQWAVVGLSSIAPLGRRTIMFFNAAIQGLNATYKLYAKNKTRAIGWALGYAAIGMIQALLHAMMDDDDDYLDMPQYERRNALMIGGNGVYFKWALPQEARAFYALGDLAVESVMGRNPHQNVIGEAIKIGTEVLPVNPTEGWRAFMPSVAIPAIELMINEDYKGAPIYSDQKWLTEEERKRTAKWANAKKGTGKMYVELARLLNNVSGGDQYDAGAINIQPEKVEHIVQSAFGGTIRTADKFFSTVMAAIDPEEEVTMRQFPFLNRFLTINDERYKNVHVNDVYDYYAAEAEHVKTLQKKYAKDMDKESLDRLRQSDEFRWMQIYSKYEKAIEGMQERIRAAEGTSERMELMKEQDELKRQMIKEISQLP